MNNLQIALQAMGMSEKPESRAPTLRDTPVDGAIGFTQPAAPCSKKETCLECSQQWRKVGTVHCAEFIYVNILSNKQAADALQSCVSQVERDFRWLQETLVAQGDLIMARWTRGARASYIKHAFPDLFPKSFPAQRLVLPPGIDWRLARQIYRETFLIPYFNAESLQKDPRRLLSLLHFRTKHDFREFVMLEKQEQEMGFKFGALGLDYNSQCVDMSVTPRYGKLTPFNETKAHTWTIVGYPRAKLILDAQVCLYGNLRRLCEILIQDNNAVRGKKGQWNNFISLGCRSSLSEEQWTPYPNRAFAGPVTLDHGYFCELATSRRAAAEDLMWLLQTDAVYAQHSIRVLSNSVAMNTADEVSATRSIVGELVNSGGDRVRNWRDIEAELHNLHDLANRSGEHKYDLSTEAGKLYNRALCSVEKMLVNVFLHQANRLKSVLRTSNGFEDHFSHKRFDSGETGSALKRIAKGRNENTAYFKKEPIVWCLMQLERDIEDDSVVDYGGLFNVLDEHIEKGTAKQRNLVDQRLYDHISDLAAVHHILSTLRLHRPLHDSTLFHKANHIEKERRYWRTLDHEERLAKLTDPQLDSLGVLMKSFNSIRLPQRQTVAKLSKSVQARRELTVFWSCARQMIGSAWRHSKSGLKTPVGAKSRGKKSTVSATEADLQTVWGETVNTRQDVQTQSAARIKAKTHGAQEQPVGQANDSDVEETAGLISVKKSSLDFFAKMFPAPGTIEDGSGGKTRWQDFVAAMADAGFAASRAVGSAVTFTSQDAEGGRQDRKIVIHRPHPESAIGPVMLRSIGKRMRKWFGWEVGLFVLREA